MSTLPPARERTVSRLAIVIAACGCCLSLRCDQVPGGTGLVSPAALTYVEDPGEEPSIHDDDLPGSPRVLTVYPTRGPASGGTRVTIQGGALVDGTAVFFGAAAAYDVVVVNNTVITAKTPPHPAGPVQVKLRGPDATEAPVPGGFTYLGMAEDTDGDGLTDAQESAGWAIAVDFYGFGADHPLALLHLQVFSDPDKVDTDGDNLTDYEEYVFGSDPGAEDTDHDGLFDAEEIDRWWTSPVSVDTDGDADGPLGDLSPNPYLFDGAELKIDFEGDPSHTPALDATSPTLPDTDADGRSDYAEFSHPVRSPILSDLPQVEVGLEDAVDIRLNVEYAEEIGKSREYGTATTTSHTHTERNSETSMVGVEIGFDIAKAFSFKPSVKHEHTWEYSTEDSATNQKEYHQFLTDSRNYTESYSSGSMSGGLRISNPGDIAYHLDNFCLTVRLWDRSYDPATGAYVGEFKTLATLTPALAAGVTLAPGDSTPVLQVGDDDVNPDVVKQFLAQPETLYLETAYYDLETAEGLNFAFIEEETWALTATVVIDFGDGNVERYHIAARVNRNPDATYAGVNLYDFLTEYLDIPITTVLVGLDGNPLSANRLGTVRGIPAEGPTTQAFWAVVGDMDGFPSQDVNFTDIVLYGGDTVMLILTADADGDGLNAYEEELYGTSEGTDDSDGDGLPDLPEARDQKQPDDSVQEAGWMVRVKGQSAYRIYSDPSGADADGDGLDDLAERGGCEVDGALAVDITDETTCTAPANNGTWHPFQGWGCVFCAEGVQGCADIDNQTDCETNGGTWVHFGTDPNRKDTDDDGLADNLDPFPTLPAGRLHVKPDGDDEADGLSWDNALATIEKAMLEWNALNCDADDQNDVSEIWLAQGTYTPPPIQLPSNLLMYGGFDGTETRFGQRTSAQGTIIERPTGEYGRALTGDGVDNLLLDGFQVAEWSCAYDGAALWLSDTENVTIRNVMFIGNEAYGADTKGGALYVQSTGGSASITLDDCAFANNSCRRSGGAAFFDGVSITARNCYFENNSADGDFVDAPDYWGGALCMVNSDALVSKCRFVNNSVGSPYGDFAPEQYSKGGAIYASSQSGNGSVYVEDSVFESNCARHYSSGCQGGAIFVEVHDFSLVNCLFHKNMLDVVYEADFHYEYDAGLYGSAVKAATSVGGERVYVTNCTFVDNYLTGRPSAWDVGTQLVMSGPGHLRVVNVLTAYDQFIDVGREPGVGVLYGTLSNCDFNRVCFARTWSDSAFTAGFDDWQIVPAFPFTTMVLDPESDTVFEDWAARNFHLAAGSPLIEWGTNLVDIDPVTPGYQFLPEFDLAGQPRIVDGNGDGETVVDVGAYEYQGD